MAYVYIDSGVLDSLNDRISQGRPEMLRRFLQDPRDPVEMMPAVAGEDCDVTGTEEHGTDWVVPATSSYKEDGGAAEAEGEQRGFHVQLRSVDMAGQGVA